MLEIIDTSQISEAPSYAMLFLHGAWDGRLLLRGVPTLRRLTWRLFLRCDTILVSKVRSLPHFQGDSGWSVRRGRSQPATPPMTSRAPTPLLMVVGVGMGFPTVISPRARASGSHRHRRPREIGSRHIFGRTSPVPRECRRPSYRSRPPCRSHCAPVIRCRF